MTRLDVLDGLLKAKNTEQFIELTYDMAHKYSIKEDFKSLLLKPLTEEELQAVKSAAQSGDYPLSLDGLQ